MSSKASTGARYYAGPFDAVDLVDPDGNPHTVKYGEAAPEHFDVRRLGPDFVDTKPRARHAADNQAPKEA